MQRLRRDGCAYVPATIPVRDLQALRARADATLKGRPGTRLFGDDALDELLGPHGQIGQLAHYILGAGARAVRAVFFDKTAQANWAVPWHQDRTIAVQAYCPVAGFGPWSVKSGMPHVEPPFDILAGMVTLRVHLDDCGSDNAPLLVAPGSHRLGRIVATEVETVATRLGATPCVASAGDVWVYMTPIVHASFRAARPDRRRVLQVDFASEDLPLGLAWAGIGREGTSRV